MKKFLLGLFIIIPMLLTGCGTTSKVATATAQPTTEPLRWTRNAAVISLHTATVTPSISGHIINQIPEVGKEVHEGEVLVQIDTTPYAAQQQRAQALANAPAAAPAATDPAVAQAQQLLQDSIITRKEYERIIARSAPAPAGNSTVAPDPGPVPSGDILSPVTGRIGAVYVRTGDVAVAGRPLLTVQTMSPLVTGLPLPAEWAPLIREHWQDDRTYVALQAGAQTLYGEITACGGSPDLPVLKLRFANDDHLLIPGQSYDITLRMENVPTQVYYLPLSARVGEDGIYIVGPDHIVQWRHITIAYTTATQMVVLAGIQAGETYLPDPPKDIEIGSQIS